MKTDIFGYLINKIPRNIKICLASGVIFGWITHFYMLTHKLPNWDDITQINSLGLTSQIGRWMLEPLQNIGQRASNPAIHGMLLILFISIAACMVVSALGLKSVTSAILVPAIMVAFPSVTGILFFMFTAHLYALGILLFCVSAYLIRRFRFGFIGAGVCLILGLAIYQPFVSVAIALFLYILIEEAFQGKTFAKLIKTGFIYAGTLAASTFIYIVIAHLIYPNMGNETYGGANEMGKMPIAEIPKNFGRVYKRVLEYFITRPFAFITPGMRIVNICICIAIAVLVIAVIAKYKMWRKKLELAFTAVMFFFVPFAVGFVYFMAPKAPFSMLMLYAYSMLYILVLLLLELLLRQDNEMHDLSEERTKLKIVTASALTCVITFVLLIGVYQNYLLDSQAYFRSSIAFERATAFYNRIVSFVESQEGYKSGDRVIILGEFYYKDNPAPIEIPVFYDDEEFRDLSGVALENGLITSGVRSNFIRTYIGFECGYISGDERDEILNSKEYLEMSIYPNKEAIKKINDVWVVKLCE